MLVCRYGDGRDGREMGPKRQRMIEQAPPPGTFYGPHPGSAFMFNPYGFVPPPVFPVVRLRGLPFDCAELDVVEFFRGLDVVDVLFVHKNNKVTGEAFCVLGVPLQVDFALHKNRQNMGRRYVENCVRARSSDDGKENAEHTGILRLRGLPFGEGKKTYLTSSKILICEDSVHVTVNGEGRPTGAAAMVKDRKMLGSRYIELFPSSVEELEDALSRGR
ncbi:hypothetical protein Bca52824_026160 [Brassica carinata]|uniref:RRM domain-containing protein n=1 Tax=Brassica carinata TaxID=52824 RepID=A0A8X7SHJ8_BRACI|nr:hypothetical protein Bca52824_026160 [Brassica carinata]